MQGLIGYLTRDVSEYLEQKEAFKLVESIMF